MIKMINFKREGALEMNGYTKLTLQICKINILSRTKKLLAENLIGGGAGTNTARF